MNIDRMLLDDFVEITTVTDDGPPDTYGDPTQTTTIATVAGAYFPGAVDDDSDRPDGHIDGTVFVRPDVTVAADSRITVAAVGVVAAEVVGRPKRWHNPRTGRVEFIQLEVTET